MVNGSAAAQWLLNLGSVDPGLCLYYVWQAYKAQGASTERSAGTAMSGWNQSDGKHPGDRNPPAGAAVWWGRRYDGNTDGDVTISLGGGRVAATDFPGWRQTGSATLDERQAQIGREYLGWTESIFDCPIQLAGTGGNAASSWNRTDRSTADIQRVIGANPDGIPGPETDTKLRAWQTANHLDADGIFGVLCDAIAFPLAVDGDPGVRTWAKLQHRVGARIDGELGPDTWTRLQTALGVPADGQPGPVTYTALQRAVGANPDGDAGAETWSKMQAFLNTGAPFPKVGPTAPKPTDPGPAATPRTPVYPGASRGWTVPLAMARPSDAFVGWLIMHHQASTGDDEPYFKTKNSRGSCPTWQIKTTGEIVEFIPPGMEPASTGDADHWAVTIEFQNATGNVSGTDAVAGTDWVITEAQHEAAAQLAAWLSQQKTIQGVPVRFTLDRSHLFGDRETTSKTGIKTRATACPGPSLDMDRIVRRALELTAPPKPDPEPKPPILTPDAATFWQRLFEWLRDFFKGAK